MLEIIKFLKNHPNDWEEILKQPPYGLAIKKEGNLVLFKYTPWDSDFSELIPRECRGIILEKDTWRPICVPFFKFFNYDEPFNETEKIDWGSARVQTKVDGSIIKIYYYDNKWNIATNSTLNADKVVAFSPKIEEGVDSATFGDLFREAAGRQKFDFNTPGKLDINKTYIFELTSKYNEQVVHYDGIQIWHLGTRDNITLQEEEIDIGVQKPEQWKLNCLEDCIKIASRFKDEQEGFVVVDKNWNRIKIKSPYYFLKSHDINDNLSAKKLADIFLSGDYEEFLSYFPKYKEPIKALEDKFTLECESLEKQWKEVFHLKNLSRFEFYNQVKDLKHFDYLMKKYEGVTETKEGKPYSAKEYLFKWVKLRQFLIDYLKNEYKKG